MHLSAADGHHYTDFGSHVCCLCCRAQESFGPFYRIEQLLLTTLPQGKSRYTTPDGLPAIVTDANIELLFDMQSKVDALVAHTKVRRPAHALTVGNSTWLPVIEYECKESNAPEKHVPSVHLPLECVCLDLQDGSNVTLEDVCYKPFAGGACATQSLLQFWRMDRSVYEKGDPATRARLSPEYCLSHWSTACRGAYGGPQVCPTCPMDCHCNLSGTSTPRQHQAMMDTVFVWCPAMSLHLAVPTLCICSEEALTAWLTLPTVSQDPHTVLGGFPTDERFRNYSADASTFVVTYPLNSSDANRCDSIGCLEAQEVVNI